MNDLPIREGDLLAGKYRIQKVLGRGGMGVVVAAVHAQLGQQVAVKFLLPEACAFPEAIGRFLREARAAVRIQSDHVARVLDVGELETGAPYIVMEFLRGSDIGELVETSGPLSIPDALDYVSQACEAIAEAHTLGIVHRDIKPRNLFLTRRPDGSGFVKVIDFGISKATQDQVPGESSSLTATTAMLGSPRYMSPEQLRSAKKVDHRTDIWALGVVLFEIMTAQEVFQADTLPGLITAIGMDPPAPLRSVRPEAPVDLERIILRCLEKDPARRYADVGELALALASLGDAHVKTSAQRTVAILRTAGFSGGKSTGAEGQASAGAPVAARVVAAGEASGPAGTGVSWGATGGATGPKRSRGTGTIALVAVGVVAAAGVAAWVLVRTQGSPSPAASVAVLAPSADPQVAPVRAVSAPLAATTVQPPTVSAAPPTEPPLAQPPLAEPQDSAPRKSAPPPKPARGAAPVKAAPAAPSAPPSKHPAPVDRGADPF
jgi:serine/threonine-protein kinase